MKVRGGVLLALAAALVACQQAQVEDDTEAAEDPVATSVPNVPAAPAAAATEDDEGEAAAEAEAPRPSAPPAAAPEETVAASDTPGAPAPTTSPQASSALARSETNWPGVFVEVTEFSRKGNTLTARLRLKNEGAESQEPSVSYPEMYVMDFGSGQRYDVLSTQDTYVAALRSGWKDRWYQVLEPGDEATIWAKFTAPPPEVTSITLIVPGTPPFDDLPIRDS